VRSDADRWNARYADLLPGEPCTPRGLSALELPAGGLCLDAACGLGETAVWAALNGFEVIALDASEVAVAATRQFAEDHGVAELVDARVHDLDEGLPGDVAGECALVVCQKYRNPELYQALVDALGDDGVLVVTELSTVGADTEPGPFHAPPGALAVAFGALDVQLVSHHEADGLATLVARRPDPE